MVGKKFNEQVKSIFDWFGCPDFEIIPVYTFLKIIRSKYEYNIIDEIGKYIVHFA